MGIKAILPKSNKQFAILADYPQLYVLELNLLIPIYKYFL